MVLLGLGALAASIGLFARAGQVAKAGDPSPVLIVGGIALVLFGSIALIGLFVVNPNEARVMQLFGKYVGTCKQEGLRWANPLLSKQRISLRVRSFESTKIKVNDVEGNPIEIGAIVVWRVKDTAEAVFAVDNYHGFVSTQSESAVRNLATHHPYDTHDDARISLRGHTDEIAEALKKEIQARVAGAGIEIVEARIAHLAYAPEIAQAMLQRQQAGAIIAARQRIVELDMERKAAMVSNLLVVLCGERATQPVVNAGTLY